MDLGTFADPGIPWHSQKKWVDNVQGDRFSRNPRGPHTTFKGDRHRKRRFSSLPLENFQAKWGKQTDNEKNQRTTSIGWCSTGKMDSAIGGKIRIFTYLLDSTLAPIHVLGRLKLPQYAQYNKAISLVSLLQHDRRKNPPQNV